MTPSDVLAAQGPLAELIDGYSPRPQQIEMAEAIADAVANGQSLICEAGTGTGKTFAYLVPAMLSGLTVIISTGTRHLQDQLYRHDLPVAQRALGLPINVALLKGRANYLCRFRLGLAEAEGRELGRTALSQLAQVRRWSGRTESGDLAELAELSEDSRVRPLVTSTRDNCLGQACDNYDECFVFGARQRAARADITIVNHHLYLADLGLRGRGHGELLPAPDLVIFDEAHQLPELASQFFSRTLSSNQWLELVRDTRTAFVKEAADLPDLPAALDALEKAVRDLRLALGREDASGTWEAARDKPEAARSFEALMSTAHGTFDVLEQFSARGKLLDNCCQRFLDLLDLLASFNERSGDGQVQWVEVRGRGFLLHQTPLDVSTGFREQLESQACPCIFTSATLSVAGDFSLFAGQLGLAGLPARSWPSPFNYRRQALLYVPEDLPDPGADSYTELAVERAIPVLELTGGRAFFLFTSYRALNIAARIIKSRIEYPVFTQGDAPRMELLEAFRSTPHAVLLGTSSFWEGVDVRGQALSCVIIDKLPFAAPDDPVLQARLRKLEEEGHNPFREYQLPAAVIDLRQGIGRLIRDRDDFGILMICDPRLLSRNYGRVFLKSLPDMDLARSLERVQAFFCEHEADS